MKTEIRSDFIGTYTAYIYDDGHVETDPPGRPMSREDVIRARKTELFATNARRTLSADVAGGASVLRSTTQTYHDTMNLVSEAMATIATPRHVRQQIVTSVSTNLGGSHA